MTRVEMGNRFTNDEESERSVEGIRALTVDLCEYCHGSIRTLTMGIDSESLFLCENHQVGVVADFWKYGFKNSSVLNPTFFCIVLSYFSKLRWITRLQIAHAAKCRLYLSSDARKRTFFCIIYVRERSANFYNNEWLEWSHRQRFIQRILNIFVIIDR